MSINWKAFRPDMGMKPTIPSGEFLIYDDDDNSVAIATWVRGNNTFYVQGGAVDNNNISHYAELHGPYDD